MSRMMEDKSYMADSDLHTLIESVKIKKDKARFSAAMKKRKEKMTAMANLDK